MTRKARNRWTRRQVLGAGAAVLAAPYFVPSHVLGDGNRPGANDRVHVGIIGLGGRARDVAKTCLQIPAMRIVSICDCFSPLCDAFIAAVGKDQKWSAYDNFHEMFEKENLDGVMVETTTHARAWIVIQAMQAGLDAYIEKPMCLTITEGRSMVDAARR
ncbi:MAG TPA: gfo/Idh/MocA family oxidoreductase, partial [Planctomycetaceae bacterium]|nr:gfo/Idh/MocA family oxidoreductase [Planctomycetaceae bacterium]